MMKVRLSSAVRNSVNEISLLLLLFSGLARGGPALFAKILVPFYASFI
jgi:hypothetical protein